jgi:hypothetical protein
MAQMERQASPLLRRVPAAALVLALSGYQGRMVVLALL